MTKADLVEQVADAIGPGITKKDCALVVDGFLNAVKRAMANGENIEIRGFGTFKVRKRKSRMARNPRTGEAVEVPSRSVPVFKPSKHLRTRVGQLDGSGESGIVDSEPVEEEPTAPTESQTRLGGGFDF